MRRRLLSLLLLLILILSGCGKKNTENEKNGNNTSKPSESLVAEADMFTDRDLDATYDKTKAVSIKLNGDTASCSSDAVKISGTTVTIQDEGTYLISGTLTDGMLVVNADENDKPHLIFNTVSITSKTSAALYILEADKVVVTLADGSKNTLENGGTFTAIDDNNIDGTIFSKQDLTLNGSGTLTVTSPANHGIVCKDDLVFTGGTYTVNSASHGLDANDSVRMTGVNLTVTSGKDGIHAENSDDENLGFIFIKDGTFNLTAEGDGISTGNYLQINDGSFKIVTGGGSENGAKQTSDNWGGFMGRPGGMGGQRPGYTQPQSQSTTSDSETDSTSIKGLKAATNALIRSGSFEINSADDSVHSNASITVEGGSFLIASGDDAFHADDTLTITNGNITITESYEGLEGLHVKVSGGTVKLVATDDGVNAAGGTDSSGTGGRGGDMFGGHGGMGGPGGMGASSSSGGSIVISGGNLYINSSGDGMDANGTLEISGGYTVVVGPTHGDTATLDYDSSATITGGTFIGTGASNMAQSFSNANQGVIAVSAGNQAAGTKITLQDTSGNTIITHEPELDFAVVILSSPDIKKGDSYTLTIGSLSKTLSAN